MLQLEEKNQNVAFKKIKSDSSSVAFFFCRDLSWPLKKKSFNKKTYPGFLLIFNLTFNWILRSQNPLTSAFATKLATLLRNHMSEVSRVGHFHKSGVNSTNMELKTSWRYCTGGGWEDEADINKNLTTLTSHVIVGINIQQRVSAAEGDSSCTTRKWMSFDGWERIRTATMYISFEGAWEIRTNAVL